jgi:uncharacterized protein YjiS (DUF1127 family)
MTPSQCSDLASPIAMSHRPWALRLLDRYFAAQALHKQHLALLRLDDSLLRDVGITRSEAIDLAASPVWDAPNHWKS